MFLSVGNLCKVGYIKLLISENQTLALMLHAEQLPHVALLQQMLSKWSKVRQTCEEIYTE